jgi:putative transposase
VEVILVYPLRAKIVNAPEDYKWCSAKAHIMNIKDKLIDNFQVFTTIKNWKEFLSEEITNQTVSKIRSHECTGRPLGNEQFINKLGLLLNRSLHHKKPGRKPNKKMSDGN